MERTQIFELLADVGLGLASAADRGFAQLDLTHSEADVMLALLRKGPGRASEVGERIGASRRRMSQVVEGLLRKGHINADVDPSDARAKLLVLTSTGRRLSKRGERLSAQWAELVLTDLDEMQLRALGDALPVILEAVRRHQFGSG